MGGKEMTEFPYTNHPMGGTDDGTDNLKSASLTLDWLREWEKEQDDGLSVGEIVVRVWDMALASATPNADPEAYQVLRANTLEWARGKIKAQQTKLRREIQKKRDYAFAESAYGSREHKLQLQAMVRAYDVVLNLIDGSG